LIKRWALENKPVVEATMKTKTIIFVALLALGFGEASARGVEIGAAPKGDAVTVASRIIKENFPTCKRVNKATRAKDGSIRARCDKADYLVFTVFNKKEGKLNELAMNCTAAKSLLNITC
jgi:hypothetical protein